MEYKKWDKIRIKTWDEITKEFEVDEDGDIILPDCWFSEKDYNNWLPENRIITIIDIDYNSIFYIDEEGDENDLPLEMIKEKVSEKTETDRGFSKYEFTDRYDVPCSLQKSSLASEDAIWLGINNAEPKIMASTIIEGSTGWANYPLPEGVFINTRMHLSMENVKMLLPILQKFVETGEI